MRPAAARPTSEIGHSTGVEACFGISRRTRSIKVRPWTSAPLRSLWGVKGDEQHVRVGPAQRVERLVVRRALRHEREDVEAERPQRRVDPRPDPRRVGPDGEDTYAALLHE